MREPRRPRAEWKGDGVLVQQAIFTSVRSGRNEGYQIASCSPGVSRQEQRELSQWGPSHDSLYDELATAESINCHQTVKGEFCVSQTVLAGREYSGRGGLRVYTHMFLVPGELLRRFGNSPFRVVESLLVSGRLAVRDDATAPLEPVPLVGRGSLVNTANLEHVAGKLGPHKLASLVNAAINTRMLGVSSHVSGKRLFTALLDLLPPSLRSSYSLTTGLKASASRQYRLVMLPNDREEHRRAIRQVRLDVIDLTGDPPAKFASNKGWPQLIYQLLREQQYETLTKVMEEAAVSNETDIDLLGEQIRERLEKAIGDAAFTSFSA